MSWEVLDWTGLYGEGWGAEIVPEAFSHPAKFSRALIRRIYQEMVGRGWLAAGDSVIDPFGGVALGGLDALLNGLHWSGVELEPRFVALGQANIALWNARYGPHMPRWGTAKLVQGDSRKLSDVLRAADASVSSPPFGSSLPTGTLSPEMVSDLISKGHGPARGSTHNAEYGDTAGNLGNLPATPDGLAAVLSSPPYADGARQEGTDHHPERMEGTKHHPARYDLAVSSPPYAESINANDRANDSKARAERKVASGIDNGKSIHRGGPNSVQNQPQVYGNQPGQLGAMPAGDPDAAISSPPFLQTSGGTSVTSESGPLADARLIERHAAGNGAAKGYGESDANLGNMAEGDAVVSSPPYEKSLDDNHYGDGIDWSKAERTNGNGGRHQAPGQSMSSHYGSEAGNIGGLGSDTFWGAARLIVAETFALLRPGAHAAWVVKRFVRHGAIVEFPDQWRLLCESVGFKTVLWVHAWVVEDNGTQLGIDGNHKQHKIQRKSFFRRLHEKKNPGTEIDWEDVIFMVKE